MELNQYELIFFELIWRNDPPKELSPAMMYTWILLYVIYSMGMEQLAVLNEYID